MTDKPDFAEEKLEIYLKYLYTLRDSRVTNMFGAASYLQAEFPYLTKAQARLTPDLEATPAIWQPGLFSASDERLTIDKGDSGENNRRND